MGAICDFRNAESSLMSYVHKHGRHIDDQLGERRPVPVSARRAESIGREFWSAMLENGA
jgi:hypothetical protein